MGSVVAAEQSAAVMLVADCYAAGALTVEDCSYCAALANAAVALSAMAQSWVLKEVAIVAALDEACKWTRQRLHTHRDAR